MAAVHFTRIEGITYTVQCSYLNGSSASRCLFVLVSRVDWVRDVFGTIEGADKVVVFLRNAGCYEEILAYDLAGDNVSAAARTNITTNKTCPMNTGSHCLLFIIM